MITITPRPPQTTSPLPSIKSLPKNDPKAEFKLAYVLVPLFALLGVILGSVAGWLVYGCLTRKPRVRQPFGGEEKSIGGPRYVSAGDDDAGAGLGLGLGRIVDVEDGRYPGPMMQEVDMEMEEGMSPFRWPATAGGQKKGVNEHRHGEEDPFLLPPSTQHKAKSRSSKSTRSVMSNATSLAFLELYESDEEALADERMERKRREEDTVPWESLRHKSIKRGILERVRKEAGWVDSLRGIVGSSFSELARDTDEAEIRPRNGNAKKRHTHVRADSDLRIEDLVSGDGVSVPDKARVRADAKRADTGNSHSKSATRPSLSTFDSTVSATTLTTKKGTRTASRANSSRTAYSTTSSDGKGFRIITESPVPHPPPLHSRTSHASHASQSNASSDSSYWWWGEASTDADVDRYTAVPARLCRSRSQSRSQSNSPVKGIPIKGSGGRGALAGEWPFASRDVLPQSPPRIMSPMLEDRLCFTPKPGQGHGRSVGVDLVTPTPPWGWGNPGVGEVPTPTPTSRSGEAGKGKDGKGLKAKGNILRSPRPPSLPFPRDPDRGLVNSPRPPEDVFRGRLVKQPVPSRKMTGLSRDKTLPGPPVHGDGCGHQREGSGDVALKKVGEIVKQSWSTRELELGEEGMRSLSPTGFGCSLR
jgi:hypothetical protein